jgi:ribosomal L7/L12-like protein
MAALRVSFRSMSPQIPEAEAAKIREEIFAGRKIGAIKMLRGATGLQLVDAKNVVEKLEEELRVSSPEKFLRRKGAGCAGVLVCGLLFVVCSAWLAGVVVAGSVAGW